MGYYQSAGYDNRMGYNQYSPDRTLMNNSNYFPNFGSANIPQNFGKPLNNFQRHIDDESGLDESSGRFVLAGSAQRNKFAQIDHFKSNEDAKEKLEESMKEKERKIIQE